MFAIQGSITLCWFVLTFTMIIQAQEDQPRSYMVNSGGYIKKEFRFHPEKDTWQQKFAEMLMQILAEDESSGHSNHGRDNILQNDPLKHVSNSGRYTMPHTAPTAPVASASNALPNTSPNAKTTHEEMMNYNETLSENSKIDANDATNPIPVNNSMNCPKNEYSDSEKGEILIHRPAPIIVNRPPTKISVNHPPVIVKPAPVIFHRPPPVIVRQMLVKPQGVQERVQPVYVKIIKPLPEQIHSHDQSTCSDCGPNADYVSQRHYYS